MNQSEIALFSVLIYKIVITRVSKAFYCIVNTIELVSRFVD